MEGALLVNMANWNKLLCWFGPLRTSSDSFLLRNIENTLRQPWFHGPLSGAEATNLLADKPVGAFLIRFSEQADAPAGNGIFTVSRVEGPRRVIHNRLHHQPGVGIVFERHQPLASLSEFVSSFKNRPPLNLGAACPGSPYAHLFPTTVEPNNSERRVMYIETYQA